MSGRSLLYLASRLDESMSICRLGPLRLMSSSSSSSGDKSESNAIWAKEDKKIREELKKAEEKGHQNDDKDANIFRESANVNYNHDGFGFKQTPYAKDVYLNPLLSPPPRSPTTVEDFKDPQRLGHWVSKGFDYYNWKSDNYKFHEMMGLCILTAVAGIWLYIYSPDLKLRDWARREAYLRTAKREALGQPLIDRNLVDPARIVLPEEEDLVGFEVAI